MFKYNALRRVLAVTLSLSIVSGPALAAEWNLSKGDITVDTSGAAQTVSQNGGSSVVDLAPVIKQLSTTATNVIIITGGGTANLTIQDLNVESFSSSIHVDGTTTANITANGTNTLTASSNAQAAVHVSDGTLNLNTTAGSTVNATSTNEGAAIGSNSAEQMTGSIHLTGSGTVNATAGIDTTTARGATIGSGYDGDLTGSISIEDTNVHAVSNGFGAGIGSGFGADVQQSGTIVTGSGDVSAQSIRSAAGIGSGEYNSFRGTIQLGSGDVTAISGSDIHNSGYGAGIGSGYSGDFTGTVITGPGKVNAESKLRGAGIGAATDGMYNGSIQIGTGEVNAVSPYGSDIGQGKDSDVGQNASVTVTKGTTINGTVIENPDQLDGIAPGIGKTQMVDPPVPETPDPEKPNPDPETSLPEEKPETAPEATVPSQVPYWVLSEGQAVKAQSQLSGGVLTVTCDQENAEFNCTRGGLQMLKTQGVKTVVFHTAGAESSFDVDTLLDAMESGTVKLSHQGAKAQLLVNNEDQSKLLK